MDRRQAQAELDALSGRLAREYPETDKGWGATVQPIHDYLVRAVRPALLLLLGAVAFVLLIACANVSNLVLVRTLGRSKEMAIRGTLGASRGRLVQQLVAEALLLALAGAVLGLYLAHFFVALLRGFLGDGLPQGLDVHLDLRILAFTLGISLFTGLAAGLVPAWSSLRGDHHDLHVALQRGLGRTDASAAGRRTRGALVAAEVALSLVLLLGAALMIESLGAGILLGSAAAVALGRALASLFYGVSATDPLLYGAVALLLAGVALLAIAGPAWRAARVPPSEALRE